MERSEQQKLSAKALEYAKKHRRAIAREKTNPAIYLREKIPVSVFMAGSPGAGKTEASIELLASFSDSPVLRIDPDELRSVLPGYTGANSWLFQGAVSVLVEKIQDMALKQSQSFLLDGTLSSYEVAHKNIARSLRKGRVVQILYVYQEPLLAWQFVLARERQEGRKIKEETFIDQYFAARDVVNRLKCDFGKDVRVDLLFKNNDNSRRLYRAGVDHIDSHIPEKYNRAAIKQLLREN